MELGSPSGPKLTGFGTGMLVILLVTLGVGGLTFLLFYFDLIH